MFSSAGDTRTATLLEAVFYEFLADPCCSYCECIGVFNCADVDAMMEYLEKLGNGELPPPCMRFKPTEL